MRHGAMKPKKKKGAMKKKKAVKKKKIKSGEY